jgi:hypothetical protein
MPSAAATGRRANRAIKGAAAPGAPAGTTGADIEDEAMK